MSLENLHHEQKMGIGAIKTNSIENNTTTKLLRQNDQLICMIERLVKEIDKNQGCEGQSLSRAVSDAISLIETMV